MTITLDCAERAQRLLYRTVFLRVSEALVLFDLGKALLFFEAELHVVEGVVGEAHEVWGDGERELPEADFAVGLVAQTPQNSIDVLLQNFLLELE